jgi:hypothetical protein
MQGAEVPKEILSKYYADREFREKRAQQVIAGDKITGSDARYASGTFSPMNTERLTAMEKRGGTFTLSAGEPTNIKPFTISPPPKVYDYYATIKEGFHPDIISAGAAGLVPSGLPKSQMEPLGWKHNIGDILIVPSGESPNMALSGERVSAIGAIAGTAPLMVTEEFAKMPTEVPQMEYKGMGESFGWETKEDIPSTPYDIINEQSGSFVKLASPILSERLARMKYGIMGEFLPSNVDIFGQKVTLWKQDDASRFGSEFILAGPVMLGRGTAQFFTPTIGAKVYRPKFSTKEQYAQYSVRYEAQKVGAQTEMAINIGTTGAFILGGQAITAARLTGGKVPIATDIIPTSRMPFVSELPKAGTAAGAKVRLSNIEQLGGTISGEYKPTGILNVQQRSKIPDATGFILGKGKVNYKLDYSVNYALEGTREYRLGLGYSRAESRLGYSGTTIPDELLPKTFSVGGKDVKTIGGMEYKISGEVTIGKGLGTRRIPIEQIDQQILMGESVKQTGGVMIFPQKTTTSIFPGQKGTTQTNYIGLSTSKIETQSIPLSPGSIFTTSRGSGDFITTFKVGRVSGMKVNGLFASSGKTEEVGASIYGGLFKGLGTGKTGNVRIFSPDIRDLGLVSLKGKKGVVVYKQAYRQGYRPGTDVRYTTKYKTVFKTVYEDESQTMGPSLIPTQIPMQIPMKMQWIHQIISIRIKLKLKVLLRIFRQPI